MHLCWQAGVAYLHTQPWCGESHPGLCVPMWPWGCRGSRRTRRPCGSSHSELCLRSSPSGPPPVQKPQAPEEATHTHTHTHTINAVHLASSGSTTERTLRLCKSDLRDHPCRHLHQTGNFSFSRPNCIQQDTHFPSQPSADWVHEYKCVLLCSALHKHTGVCCSALHTQTSVYYSAQTHRQVCTTLHRQTSVYFSAQTHRCVLLCTDRQVCTSLHKHTSVYFSAQTHKCVLLCTNTQTSVYYSAQTHKCVPLCCAQTDKCVLLCYAQTDKCVLLCTNTQVCTSLLCTDRQRGRERVTERDREG